MTNDNMEDEIKVEIPEVPEKAATKKTAKKISCHKNSSKAKQRRRKKSLLQKQLPLQMSLQIIQDIR